MFVLKAYLEHLESMLVAGWSKVMRRLRAKPSKRRGHEFNIPENESISVKKVNSIRASESPKKELKLF